MNFGKVCIVRIKTLETSVIKNLKTFFLSVLGVGWNFSTLSYTTSYTAYLFDNQTKMIVGVGCRKD